MTPAGAGSRRAPAAAWVAQMIGTLVLAGAVLVFARSGLAQFGDGDPTWRQYAVMGILLAIAPPLLYLRTYKPLLDADAAAVRRLGAPEPAARARLLRALAIGGALCELPMALGVVQLFFGGETRWFLGATLVTIALRLSYRPFTKG